MPQVVEADGRQPGALQERREGAKDVCRPSLLLELDELLGQAQHFIVTPQVVRSRDEPLRPAPETNFGKGGMYPADEAIRVLIFSPGEVHDRPDGLQPDLFVLAPRYRVPHLRRRPFPPKVT